MPWHVHAAFPSFILFKTFCRTRFLDRDSVHSKGCSSSSASVLRFTVSTKNCERFKLLIEPLGWVIGLQQGLYMHRTTTE